MPTVHTFGDSHVSGAFTIPYPQFKIHRLGAVLCHSFGKEGLGRLNIKKYNVQENDICIFSFGEIDCRCHIHKHITTDKTYQNIIDDIVIKYFKAVEQNISQYNNLTVYIYNIVPTCQLHNTWTDEGYPFLGSDEDRKSYVLYFNEKLKEYCSIYNYNFFNIYDKYIDEDGYLNKEYSDDHVHIKDSKYIIEFVEQNNILV